MYSCRQVFIEIEGDRTVQVGQRPAKLPEVGTILYNCAERCGSRRCCCGRSCPTKMQELWRRIGCGHYTEVLADRGAGQLHEWAKWGQLEPGTPILQGDPLFPRYNVKK